MFFEFEKVENMSSLRLKRAEICLYTLCCNHLSINTLISVNRLYHMRFSDLHLGALLNGAINMRLTCPIISSTDQRPINPKVM